MIVFLIPPRVYPPLTDSDIATVSDVARAQELKDARLKLQNDVRTTLVQAFGALLVLTGAAIGACVSLQQVWETRNQIKQTADATRNQLKLGEQGQVTDRYTKAVDQLDEKNALAVRLGGLYALERIARDSPDDRTTIAEVLCAYARTAPRPDADAIEEESVARGIGNADELLALTVRAPDVQAALNILGRWQERLGKPPPVLDLHTADFRGANFYAAKLEGANLVGAQLQNANLQKTQLQGAILIGAQLQDAKLDGAQLQGAILSSAWLNGAMLWNAQLQHANLEDANADNTTGWPEGWDRERARAARVHFVDQPHRAHADADAPPPDF